mgnify:CR=1 FL=1
MDHFTLFPPSYEDSQQRPKSPDLYNVGKIMMGKLCYFKSYKKRTEQGPFQ